MTAPLLTELLLLRGTLCFGGSRRLCVYGLGRIGLRFRIVCRRARLSPGIAALARAGLGLSWCNIGLGLGGLLRT
jgi:hypothetical protein